MTTGQFERDEQVEHWLRTPAQPGVPPPPDFLRRAQDYLRRRREREAAERQERREQGRRSAMTAREKSDYISRHGREAYLSLPW
jgi:hypothetical protein